MKNSVVFTGAGISAESGLKTFRDSGGLWEQHKITDVATPEAWYKNPKLVLEFYNERRKQVLKATPNLAHNSLTELETFFNVSIITQNIDDLHERAGSKNVVHLHGEINKARSTVFPELIYDFKKDLKLGDKCEKGYQLRPHIVWFGEQVPNMEKAYKIVESADIFIIIGTSLNVYPAAGLLDCIPNGCVTYLIDPSESLPIKNKEINHIQKTATIGVPELVKSLLG